MNEAPPAEATIAFRVILSIEGAKTVETRDRRIAKAVATLREERT